MESGDGASSREPVALLNLRNGGRDRDRTGDPLLAKQVLSQLSYTPTEGTTYILKHFRKFQNPFLCFSSIWSEPPERDSSVLYSLRDL